MKFTCPSNDASPLAPNFRRHLVQKTNFRGQILAELDLPRQPAGDHQRSRWFGAGHGARVNAQQCLGGTLKLRIRGDSTCETGTRPTSNDSTYFFII